MGVPSGLPEPPPLDGRQSERAREIQRGVVRLLALQGCASVTELVLATGRRADVVGLSASGELWIVEIKSSVEDFRSDQKWPEYRDFCDRFFFAVAVDFPSEILPADTGLVLADRYGGEVVRDAPEHRLAGARRKAVTLRFATAAANRLAAICDPRGRYP
ncbi:MAG: MmcB family DNA repair protein [Hyphomicrobiaceae bacterium]|nr:MmcB family DNA repair protein [Hyphomicrobiaceae bacterium]